MSYPNSLGSPATVTSTSVPTAKQSSISVAVRVRPFTEAESNRLVKIDNDDVFLGDGVSPVIITTITITVMAMVMVMDLVQQTAVVLVPQGEPYSIH